ncbi:MAG TPA: zf-HC2 domain-containing protein [Gemmatimonadaceae bacterium]|nr:zf-HC2 domain-containing protein [Gemmatimonadaceae bacterium]
MQHLDEGTIHSWLDGALSPEEAARVEAHVKDCPQCAAAVAEARGFIAASSRILTALDNAPRGVIPAAARKRRVDPLVWRIAATLLVVAGGTLVVARGRGSKLEMMLRPSVDSSVTSETASVPDRAATAMNAAPAPINQSAAKTPVNKTTTATTFSGKGVTGNSRQTERRAYQQLSDGMRTGADQAAARERVAATAPQPVPAAAPTALSDAAARDAAAEPDQLKVVGNPRRIGARVTLYEVAPGDTVTLTESLPLSLNGTVTTGAAAAVSPQVARKMAAQAPARTDAAAPAVVDNQRAAAVPSSAGAASAPAPPSAFGAASAINLVSWKDPATGAMLTLSGRLPTARLQEIKIRIERERAAAAAKKNP